MTLVDTGAFPAALLFSENIDSLAAAGVILADVWVGKSVITIDSLGKEFLDTVKTGDSLEIRKDGTVIIQ